MKILFNHEFQFNDNGKINLFEFNVIRNGIQNSIKKSKEYYQSFPQFISNQHILIRLLLNLNVSLENDTMNYIYKVSEATYPLTKFLGFTTPDSIGKVTSPGDIYGPVTDEIYLANIEPFETVDLESYWKDLKPLRVIYHPINDIGLNLLDGSVFKELNLSEFAINLAVISVNVPMLAIQYRFWKIENMTRGVHGTIHQFLSEYPLANLIDSHCEIALFNHFLDIYFNKSFKPNSVLSKETSFFTTDYNNKIDIIFYKFIKLIENKNWDFSSLLNQFPTIGSDSFLDVIKLPDLIENYNTRSTFFICYLPLIYFLLNWSDNEFNFSNRDVIYKLQRDLIKFKSNKLLLMGLNKNTLDKANSFINLKLIPLLK